MLQTVFLQKHKWKDDLIDCSPLNYRYTYWGLWQFSCGPLRDWPRCCSGIDWQVDCVDIYWQLDLCENPYQLETAYLLEWLTVQPRGKPEKKQPWFTDRKGAGDHSHLQGYVCERTGRLEVKVAVCFLTLENFGRTNIKECCNTGERYRYSTCGWPLTSSLQ